MLEHLFRFPIVMIDADNEERKIKDRMKFGDLPGESTEQGDYDMIEGYAEYPYWDFIGIEDRWLPNRASIDKAMNDRIFEGCIVRFANAGQMLVPMSRKEFKASISKFIEKYKATQPEQPEQRVVKIKTLSAEEFKRITEDGKSE